MNIQDIPYTKLQHTLQLAYNALGLLNKLSDSSYRTKTKSSLFGLINRLRAAIRKGQDKADYYVDNWEALRLVVTYNKRITQFRKDLGIHLKYPKQSVYSWLHA